MRIQVSHETIYRYGQPARGVIQTLRLTPRNHESQYVVDWRIDVSENCRVDQHEDAFGNITHVFDVDGPVSELRVLAEGEVDTQDSNGVVRGVVERFPESLYLRETPLTHADPAICDFAEEARAAAADGSALSILHRLLERIHDTVEYDDKSPTTPATTAAEVFALKRGVCQDYAHILIASKTIGFEWPTVRALILMRLGPNRVPSPADIEGARVNFVRLMPSTAQRVVDFWKSR